VSIAAEIRAAVRVARGDEASFGEES